MKSRKVYIEDINTNELEGKESDNKSFDIQPHQTKLPMKFNEHIFEIDEFSGENAIINNFKNKSYMNDLQLIDFIEKNAPELQSYFNQAPIEVKEIKDIMTSIFDDMPEQLFEGSTYIDILIKVINHIIRKETMNFIIHSIKLGKLDYDEDKHIYPILWSSFYRISKFNHNIASFLIFIEAWEVLLEEHFWKTTFANETEQSIKYLIKIKQFYNFLGRQYSEFITMLSSQQTLIKKERVHNKHSGFKVPANYWDEIKSTNENINKALNKLKTHRLELLGRKNKIESILREKKSIKKEAIDTILSGKLGAIKYLLKKWAGYYK